MAALTHENPFDPLIDLDGLWTVELAERYLPIEGMPPARYEAVGGRIRMSPREGSANSWATAELVGLLRPAARSAGHALYTALNVRTGLYGWIEPDLVLLRERVRQQTWIEAEQVLCPIEIISPSSYHRDRIDKPAVCAGLGIPYYLHVEIRADDVEVELLRLGDDGRYTTHARARSGELFQTAEPFPMSFDPAELLESY
ncbi:Uma2 family endonuclease [Kribbella albertanoniae]|uniref:Uma2 family endonuclease n=1 Tax=Kribbella albertanoniae TaxID=1266829 RepID=A0A4R4QBT8_9ACTN|nr:Uma2 family endonuclease [Kribbella albertanoniae]TDC32800.1 Uma2 family endonuclease [Kribbella albertanoniae]